MDDNSGGELAICWSPGAPRGEASPGGGPTQQTPRRRRLMDGDEKGSEEGVKGEGRRNVQTEEIRRIHPLTIFSPLITSAVVPSKCSFIFSICLIM